MSPLGDDALDSHPPSSGIFRNPLRLNDLSCRTHVRLSIIHDVRSSSQSRTRSSDDGWGSDTAGCL